MAMKHFCTHRTALFVVFSLLLSFLAFNVNPWRGTAQELQEPLLPLRPSAQDRIVTLSFIQALERHHISRRTLDSTLSKEAFRLYIRSLDPRKMFFYQSDIDELKAKYELKLCELIQEKPVDIRPAFEIYNLYLIRLKERVGMVQEILAAPMDFTVDEEYVYDKLSDFVLDDRIVKEKGLQTFPKTTEAAYDRWRKKVKSELLEMKAAVMISEQKREKAVAEGKEPEEVDDRDPVERLQKRYVSLQKRTLLEGRIENKEILNSVRRQANDEVMERFLTAIAGALDPHSSYMSPSTVESFNTDMGKNFQGIGATLSSEDGYIVVMEVISGSPAEKAGIRPKDKIQGVGQGNEGKIEDVVDFKVPDVVKLIRGPKETTVRLDILPGGKSPSKVVEIVRDVITLDDRAVQADIFEFGQKTDGNPYKIGFIKLPDFYLDMDAVRQREDNVRSATTDVKNKLSGFVKDNVDVVVLDLRYNGGGSLQVAIEITGLFMGAGTVVQVKDEVGSPPQPRDNADSSCAWTGPLVVLTNKLSASASEILAGAIKDYKRGLIVGDFTSHGKGTVQSVLNLGEPLGSGSSLGSGRITIQGYYLPSGISPQGGGVNADIVLPAFTDVMEGVMESDLDNALTFRQVNKAPNFTPKNYVSPQIIAELKRRSEQRVSESEEFAKQMKKIVDYKEDRRKRSIPLNEAAFMTEFKRFDSAEWEQDELEELLSKESKIKRDFYVDEVLALATDYVKVTQELGVAFPKERSIQQPPRRSWFGFGL